MKPSNGNLTLLVLIICLSAFGCAQAPIKVQPIAKSENPTDHVGQLGADLAAAKDRQINLLAPNWYVRAQASYERAKEGLDRGAELAGILENTAKGSAELKQAYKYADKSKYHLAEVIESRKMARKAGAEGFVKEYQTLERDFIRLTTAVEDDDFSYVTKHKKALDGKFRDLELRAIKSAALDNVRHLLEILRDKDANKAAPQSFAMAVAKLNDADDYITENRYDQKGIQARAEAARFYAERAQNLAVTAANLEEKPPESIALWVETFLHQTNMRLSEPDRRNVPFEVQQENIINAIDLLQNSYNTSLNESKARAAQIETLSERAAELEGRTYQVKADRERLAAEKRFNELYNKVSGYFSTDEAEVYKRADQMIIRMKSMRFPVGQAVIMPENYPLLTKVQKAIRTFGDPDVLIEGHTDSTGSQVRNQLLSQNRAEAVRQYLIANRSVPVKKIKAQGYGSSRPLASNETPEGRAVNRRIDIVLMPKMKAK
jgi:outer membrane protein OmpA-like peptidoglycan-associated protein